MGAEMGELKAMLHTRENSTENGVFHKISKGKTVHYEIICIEVKFVFSFHLWPRFFMMPAFSYHSPQMLLFRPV